MGLLEEILGETGDERKAMDDMDIWTKTLMKALVPPLLESKHVTDDWLAAPPDKGRHACNSLATGDTKFYNLEKDTSCGDFPMQQWAALKFTQTALDLEDLFISISKEEVPRLLKETQLDIALPKAIVPFENPSADSGLIRQAFYGFGSHLLTKASGRPHMPEGAVFMVDFSELAEFEVRHGFAQYGTCAYFDAQQQPLAMWHNVHQLVKPSDGYKWEVAKFAWRVDMLTYVTAVNHLYNLHFTVAAQALRASREALSKDHPLKRCMEPFLMRTALVNNKAGAALLPKQSIIHHITAFTWKSITTMAAAKYQTGNEWEGLETTLEKLDPAVKSLVDEGKLPYYQDGHDVYQCFKKYFDSHLPESDVAKDADIVEFWKLLGEYSGANKMGYLQELSRTSLLEALATFAWRVTAGHCHVGTFREHAETPIHAGFRSTHNAIQVDKQAYVGGLLLLAVTSLTTPALLSKFDRYWQSDKERTVWNQLQDDLQKVSATIDERNKTRPFRYEAANPKHLECAVSV